MKLQRAFIMGCGRLLLGCCAVMTVEVLLAHRAAAQEKAGFSRWSVGSHLGIISNDNEEAMRLGADGDSLDPLDVGIKDGLRAGISLDYDALREPGFGLWLGGFYSRSLLDFGLGDRETGVARHLGDASLHIVALTASFDVGDHGLFSFPDHNNFLLTTGLVIGTAWISTFSTDLETAARSDIADVSAGSEIVLGFQSRLLWRVFGTRWLLSLAGGFLHGRGDSFLELRTGPGRRNTAARSAFDFAVFEAAASYRL